MKLNILEAKFAVGPTIANVVRTYISTRQKDLEGIKLTYDTDSQLLRIKYKGKEIYIPVSNLAYFEAMPVEKESSGPTSQETRKSPAAA